MELYPANLNIKNRLCLVVGAGEVGSRKIKTLLKCKARVKAISPFFSDNILNIKDHRLSLEEREYKESDIKGAFLVIAATSNFVVNSKIADDAEKEGILCNIIDNPERCSFTLPSFIERGDLVITVSTNGKSPLIAKKIRKELDLIFGEEYREVLKAMGIIRKEVLRRSSDSEKNRDKFRNLVEGGLLELAKEKRYDEIDKLLLDILGEGFIFKDLVK